MTVFIQMGFIQTISHVRTVSSGKSLTTFLPITIFWKDGLIPVPGLFDITSVLRMISPALISLVSTSERLASFLGISSHARTFFRSCHIFL